VKVLHLIDPHAPGGGACTLRLLAEALERLRSVHQDVLLLGNRAHRDLAQRCGVNPIGLICPPLNHPALARGAVARTIGAREAAQGRYDLIHAWTPQSAIVAVMAAPQRPRIVTLAVGPVSGIETQVVSMLMDRHATPVLASSSAVRREYLSLGLDRRLMSVLPPAVNPESVESEDRAALRRRWGIPGQAFVIGSLSEPTNWVDARTAISVVTRVAATGREVRLLLHHSAARRVEAERWAARLELRSLMVMDDAAAEPWRVVSGLDAALLFGGELNSMDLSDLGSPLAALTGGGRRLRPMPGIMPLLWAMSAAVPVIAEASDAVKDAVVDGQSGLLVDQGDVNAAADRIIRVHDDATIAGRIGMQARAAVQRRFHVSAYCVRLKEAYARLMSGRTVRVGELDHPLVERFERSSRTWADVEKSAVRQEE